jgi:hypothetical protein
VNLQLPCISLSRFAMKYSVILQRLKIFILRIGAHALVKLQQLNNYKLKLQFPVYCNIMAASMTSSSVLNLVDGIFCYIVTARKQTGKVDFELIEWLLATAKGTEADERQKVMLQMQ